MMKQIKPVCAECEEEYDIDRNGVIVVQVIDGEPVRNWRADRMKCPECGHKITSNYGKSSNLRKPENSKLQEKRKKQIEKGGMIVADDGQYEDCQALYVIGD